jgi:CBS domain-containing protein
MVNPGSRPLRLDSLRVADCMHHGILSCRAEAPLAEAAALMARHHVHAVAVVRAGASRPIGFVSVRDVVAAAAADQETTALAAAATAPLTVSADASVQRAAQLMSEHGVTHLIVVDAASGYPTGVLSALDVAAAYASIADGPSHEPDSAA